MVLPGAVMLFLLACAPENTITKDPSGFDPGDSGWTPDSGESAADSADTGAADTSGARDSGPAAEFEIADVGVVKLTGVAPGHGVTASGLAVALAGDVDGDGFGDMAIGVAGDEWGTAQGGVVYLFRGPVEVDRAFSDADAVLFGVDGEAAGYSVAGAGDVNGDGLDDVLVGAPEWPDPGGSGGRPGAVHLVYGPVSGEIGLADADATLSGESAYDGMVGGTVAAAGDVNGDGYDDVLVGGFEYMLVAGVAYVVLGPLHGSIDLATQSTLRVTGSGADWVGMSVGSAADTDGDGLADVLIGGIGGEPAAWQFNGPLTPGATLDDADARFYDRWEGDPACTVASAGDMNGDGYGDVMLAAPKYDVGGDVVGGTFVMLGPTTGDLDLSNADASIAGRSSTESASSAVAGAGDIDADGRDDILIGAPDAWPEGPGTTWLVYGPAYGAFSLDEADVLIRGEGGDDRSGSALAGGKDVDADGIPDLLIAGPGDDDGGEDAGAAWLVYGSLLPAR